MSSPSESVVCEISVLFFLSFDKKGLGKVKMAHEDERLPKDMQAALQRASFILPRDSIQVNEKIGKGAFSEVFQGRYKNMDVAIKRVPIHDEKDKDAEKYLHTELAILTNVQHRNLLKYHGAAFERMEQASSSSSSASGEGQKATEGAKPPRRDSKSAQGTTEGRAILIVTELLKGGDLSTLLLQHPEVKLPWKLKLSLAHQISQAIDHLHQKELIHRDIKTENILVDHDWRPVLADYGLTRKPSSSRAMTICGTDEFMAPEVIFGESYDESADVFSFGMVLAEIIYRKRPGKNGFLERSPRTKFNVSLLHRFVHCGEYIHIH